MEGMDLTVSNTRVWRDTTFLYRFSALYESDGTPDTLWQTINVTVNVMEAIPEPEFVLTADSSWDGIVPLVLRPNVLNLDAIKASPDSAISYSWNTSGVSVSAVMDWDSLVMNSAYEDGDLKVEFCLDNGLLVCRSMKISVKRELSVKASHPGREKPAFSVNGQVKMISPASSNFNKIEITDVYGRFLRVIPISSMVVWDGRNQAGRKVVSGVYIVHFLGEKHSARYKIVITR